MPTQWDYNSTIGGAGTAPGYTGPYDPGSAMNQWWGGVVTAPYDYTQAGFDPNNPFGTTMVNPNTGETFAITPGMEIANQWGNQKHSAPPRTC